MTRARLTGARWIRWRSSDRWNSTRWTGARRASATSDGLGLDVLVPDGLLLE